MTTRREVITKCGLGIAGIIAAGKAPAAIVKSVVGARELGFSGKAEPFDNPYVTDGLVSMFDGEWNVSLGKHDSNATIWQDIVNKNLSFVANKGRSTSLPYFKDTHAVLEGNAYYINNANLFGAASHIEVIFLVSSNNGSSGCLLEFEKSGVLIGPPNAYWGCYQKSSNNGTNILLKNAASSYGVISFSIDISDKTNFIPYFNGILTQGYGKGLGLTVMSRNGLGVNGWYDRDSHQFFGNIYCIRLYNRALTPNEVAQNYSIDHERFFS